VRGVANAVRGQEDHDGLAWGRSSVQFSPF
jgi:hypothetical protein